MPVQLSGPAPSSVDVVDILLACHARIRTFADSAVRLAAPGVVPEEAREAAAKIRYYFRAAFPSHVDDENDSLLPRMGGLSPEIDAALTTMEREHDEHAAPLARLLALCDALVEDPARLESLREELGTRARWLREAFEQHLTMEETIIFPAIRERLSHETRDELLYEAKARRGDG